MRPREEAPLLFVRVLDARVVRAERFLLLLLAPARLARADDERLDGVPAEAERREPAPADERDETERAREDEARDDDPEELPPL